MERRFDLQGHRGARGLKPENTLSGFDVALDLGVTTIETDVHLTHDGVPILLHDPMVSNRLFSTWHAGSGPAGRSALPVSTLTLEQVRRCRADRNPDPVRFPGQNAAVTPAAECYGQEHGLDPYAPPTVADLFAFARAYAGALGTRAGKSAQQQEHARRVRFDLELKRVPFHPEAIGDDFNGNDAGLLEQRVAKVVRAAGMVGRTTVRSFDHRSVRALRRLEPGLTGAVLVSGTAPVAIPDLVRQADAQVYCPDFTFLDLPQVRQAHAAGIRVVPWTVNEAQAWERLLDWGVDGITTDYPDRLAAFLQARQIPY